jgi:NAD(P)-dependent dehydrogenase (short-subunit alcohol dehydrogenase family)
MSTWFITGTSTGFGRHLAEQLLARGDRVAATVRRLDTMADLAQRYGDRLWVAELDVTDTAEVRTTIDRAFAELGRVDVVVSNAGYGQAGAAEELTDESISRQLDTNLLGSIQVVRAVLPHLRAQGGGRILQLSSMGGQIAFPGLSVYHASKWGIEGFLEAVRDEVAPFGIGITIVEPGAAHTDFGSRSLGVAPAMAEYAQVMAPFRNQLTAAGAVPGDPAKMAAAMIESADRSPAPRRLTLGSDAYELVTTALRDRLDALVTERDLAYSTDG